MRLRNWLACTALLTMALLSPGSARGQGLFVDPGINDGCPPGAHGMHGGHGGGHGGLDSLHAASVPIGAAGFDPAQFQPHPQMSPFETGSTTHRYTDGFWFRDTHGPSNIWFSRVSGTIMSPRRIHGSPIELVGDPIAFTGPDHGIPTASGATIITNKVFEDDPDPFGPRDALQTREKLKNNPGVRIAFGWITPGDYGVEFNGWLNPSSAGRYSRGDGNFAVGTVGPAGPNVLHALGLPNGAVPFDSLFALRYTSLSTGGGVNFMSNDVWPSAHVSMRVMYGVRYIHIWEEFSFRGLDSGANTANGAINRQSFDSTVTTNLVGPQIGLDYHVGGDTFSIHGQSKAGVMVNFTDYQLGGVGIGDPLNNAAYDPNLRFARNDEHSHLSPLIEQSLRLEFDVVPLLPVLNKMHILENSKVHVGYSVILGWQIARPHHQILYRNQPQTLTFKSHLAEHRKQWYTHGWQFGFTSTW